MNLKLYLENRWGIKGWWQIILIIVVFAITGTSCMYITKFFMNLLGITADTNGWIRTPIKIALTLVIYQFLLVWIGFLFGQFDFFWKFEKKMWGRFSRKKKDL